MADINEQQPTLQSLNDECGEILVLISETQRDFSRQLDTLFERLRRHQMAILHMQIVAQRTNKDGEG